MTIERFVPHADFFSIGTNDLTQYVLAAERGNGDLDALQDAAHPAVIRAIREVCRGAGERHVSVCGDAASDPVTAVLMIGAGVRCLSVRPNRVGTIKAAIRSISAAGARQLAAVAMDCDDGPSVRRLVAAQQFSF